MAANFGLFSGQDRSAWIRLRTLIFLRWIAIVGQLTTITVAQRIYGLQLELGLCYLAIGVSVMGNLIAIFVFPENKRLSEFENFSMVFFDLLQLGFLLFLTGGLNNPFALLLLAPVTISAAVLNLRSFLIMAGAAILIVMVLSEYHIPLRTEQGFILRQPDIFVFGHMVGLVIAVLFIGAYSRRIAEEVYLMSDALSATQLALSREQKLTDLGGVVAAAAHELGTPLATIKLTSSELAEELSDKPHLREDAELIRQQADRCRDILRSMGRAGNDDLHFRQAPLLAVVEEAAEPHTRRGKAVQLDFSTDDPMPIILRKPEIIHGLRNLVQNAVDFARSSVWIEGDWTEDTITLRIIDDGRGFPLQVIGRIGDPFVRKRKGKSGTGRRPGYEGMGLGLFIAKTLLERSGAGLRFANGRDLDAPESGMDIGAIVEVTWPRTAIDPTRSNDAVPIGAENRPLEV